MTLPSLFSSFPSLLSACRRKCHGVNTAGQIRSKETTETTKGNGSLAFQTLLCPLWSISCNRTTDRRFALCGTLSLKPHLLSLSLLGQEAHAVQSVPGRQPGCVEHWGGDNRQGIDMDFSPVGPSRELWDC